MEEEVQKLNHGGGTSTEESRGEGLQEFPQNGQKVGMTKSQEVYSSEKQSNMLSRLFPSPHPTCGHLSPILLFQKAVTSPSLQRRYLLL